jgi:hypothetical protein
LTAHESKRGARRPPAIRVGDVRDAFVAAVEGAVDGLPGGALERLARGGVTIRVASTLTAALPELRRVPVPAGCVALGASGWDGIAGAYVWNRGRIGIAEYVDLMGTRFDNEYPEYALRHEVGHALDDLGHISSSAGFALAWRAGTRRADSLGGFAESRYFTDPRSGKREVFAEAFAIATRTGASPVENGCIGRYFGDALRYVTSYARRLRDDDDHR